MGLVNRFERKLESTVGDAFARVFGGSIVPQEVEGGLQREAEAGARDVGGGRILAPNDYVITLSVSDCQKVSADPALTATTFARYLEGYIRDQGWQTYGEVVVRFESSPNLHTGQFRTRGAVNPDSTASEPAPAPTDRTDTAEPGVPPMTDNPSHRGGPGQGQPGDDYYDYGRQAEERSGAYPPDQAGYPPQGAPQPGYPPRQPGYPDQGAHPEPGGYPPPQGAPPPAYPPRPAGYPDQAGYPEQGGYPPQGGYPDQGYGRAPGGYPPGGQGGGYPAPGAEYDYGRQPAAPQPQDDYGRPDQGGYPPAPGGYPEQGGYPAQPGGYPEQPGYPGGYPDQGGYPEQGGYPDQAGYGAQGYGGRQDYAQPDYGRYADPAAAQPAGYADPGYPAGQPAGYEYGQQPGQAGGYGPGFGSGAATVTLQLDDGSGRTYQLREGANVIGRGQDAQFRLPDTGVSRRHLEIRWDGQLALLSDLNSTNGTTVNNAPVQEWQLADGDVIRLGHSEIIVRVH
jgi:Protein of unknown function (DUF3662)/FHA domain